MTIESNTINSTSEITDDIIRRQLDRKRVLDHELQRDKQRLEIMQYDITILERSFTVSDLDRLIEEIQFLRSECNKMSEILDKAGVHAIGDTTTNISNSISGINGEFYFNLKLFFNLLILFAALSINSSGQQMQHISGTATSIGGRLTPKPPRPPIPSALRTVTSPQRSQHMPPLYPPIQPTFGYNSQSSSFFENENDDFGRINSSNMMNNNMDCNNMQPWTCSACTFHNHPLLNKCEQCEQPRIPTGTIQISATHFQPQLENVHYQQSVVASAATINANNNSIHNIPFQVNQEPFSPQLELTNSVQLMPNVNRDLNNQRTLNSSASMENILNSRGLDNSGNKKGFKKGHRYTPSM